MTTDNQLMNAGNVLNDVLESTPSFKVWERYWNGPENKETWHIKYRDELFLVTIQRPK